MSRIDPIINDAPTAIYASAQTQAPAIKLVATRQASSFASRRDYLKYLTHEVNNAVQADGRINMGYDDKGRVMANSVSPYSQKFWDNVEPKIHDLVKALRLKRYLTYSSCEGHCLQSRRFVGLAFWSDKAREEFAKRIEKLGLLGVKCRRLNHVANMVTKEKPDGSIDFARANKVTANDYDSKDEVDGFNISFHRKYERYYFLELIIFDEAPDIKGPISLIKATYLKTLKKYLWEKSTAKITAAISSHQFPTYSH